MRYKLLSMRDKIPTLVGGLTVFFLGGVSLFADCRCRKIARGESTHWGGNELIIQHKEKPYEELKGIVLDPTATP
jgi:hypothetical protein